ncbi:hypothetical protein EVAR_29352_1 [Eumeta japonica]|uniref:Uncharacterized protein n=1 Tax=Eumeta variegata TaxID=151549 RepID=A0A4C1WHR3_EUMVA|nr:hypothetical protein EVAR_29352_1 [Eumeta japonica]
MGGGRAGASASALAVQFRITKSPDPSAEPPARRGVYYTAAVPFASGARGRDRRERDAAARPTETQHSFITALAVLYPPSGRRATKKITLHLLLTRFIRSGANRWSRTPGAARRAPRGLPLSPSARSKTRHHQRLEDHHEASAAGGRAFSFRKLARRETTASAWRASPLRPRRRRPPTGGPSRAGRQSCAARVSACA